MSVTAIGRRERFRSHADRIQVEHAPVDLWSWMGQAATESDAAATGSIHAVKPKDLKAWNIERDARGSTVKLTKDRSKDILLENTQRPQNPFASHAG